MDDEQVDPFADGVVTPEELLAEPDDQPFGCAACGLGLGDNTDARCPACGADLTAPGARVATGA